MRAHVILPEQLVEEIDRLAGKRGRSAFIEEAVRSRLAILRQQHAMRKGAGILKDYDYPDWATPEKTSEWVRKSRELDNQRLEEMLARWKSK